MRAAKGGTRLLLAAIVLLAAALSSSASASLPTPGEIVAPPTLDPFTQLALASVPAGDAGDEPASGVWSFGLFDPVSCGGGLFGGECAEARALANLKLHLGVLDLGTEEQPQASQRFRCETAEVTGVFGFHGRPEDPATGLIYFRNRWYSADLGRFVSTDPLGYADGPSLYSFAGDDPLNMSDPLGLKLKILGKDVLDLLRETVPAGLRDHISLDANSFIDRGRLAAAKSDDANFLALREIVEHDLVVEASTAAEVGLLDERTKERRKETFSYESVQDQIAFLILEKKMTEERAREIGKELVAAGVYGITLSPSHNYNPHDDRSAVSPTGNLAVVVASEEVGLPAEERPVTLAHELYGHALLYLRKQEWTHPEPAVETFISEVEERTRRLVLSPKKKGSSRNRVGENSP